MRLKNYRPAKILRKGPKSNSGGLALFMKIFFLSNWFPPFTSGSSFYTSSLAQTLASRGHEVHVVTLDWGPEFRPAAAEGLTFHLLPVIRLPKLPFFYNLKLMGIAFTPSNLKRLRSLIREHQPDILHHVNHVFDTNFLSVLSAKMEKLPVVGSITTPVQHQNPWVHGLYTLIDRMTIGFFGTCQWDGIVSLDHTAHEYIGHVYGRKAQKKSKVIPFGVPLGTTELYVDNPVERSGCPQILMVGHIHPFRDPTLLIRAMPLILKRIPQAKLVLAGRVDLPGPVNEAKKLGLSSDQVSFLGETPHDETVRLLKTSHIFASWVTGPFLGLGTAPMEAMLSQTPVINDLPENLFGEGKLKDGDSIALVNSRDHVSIANKIIQLLTDEPYRQRVGAGGRKFVLENLHWDRIAEAMEQFYGQILMQKGRSLGVTRQPETSSVGGK